jgi:uncharacterized membrane protein YphA (DoxX/SURF4 family)
VKPRWRFEINAASGASTSMMVDKIDLLIDNRHYFRQAIDWEGSPPAHIAERIRMHIAATVLSILLAFVALAAGAPKLVLKGPSAQLQSHMGLSAGLVRFIGLAEVAAAVGLVVGLFWRPLGVAAAVGLAGLFIGAIGFHAKAGDYSDPKLRTQAMVPIVLALVAAAAAAILAVTLSSH